MTLGLPGAPDWQTQVAGSLVPFPTIGINLGNGASGSTDVTTSIQPHYTGLGFIWLDAAHGAAPIQVQVQIDGQSTWAAPPFTLSFGELTPVAIVGQVATIGAGHTITVVVTNNSGGTVTGSLFVFGITVPLLSIPVLSRPFVGVGLSTGEIQVNAGLTGLILNGPGPAAYYRIKALSWRVLAAPAANLLVNWFAPSTGNLLIPRTTNGLANQTDTVITDVQWQDGIQLQNTTAINIRGQIVYELWSQ